jgi:peptidoglycan/LPS O-acetylase OafA/YrhL
MSDFRATSEDSESARRRSDAPTLEQAALGHDNNLNLLRAIAAMLVLVSHSVTVATGMASREPGRQWLGLSLGDIAVDIFFVVSGFLVTGSLRRSNSLKKYVAARGLRIVPGLWIALLLSVLVVSWRFSANPPLDNLLDSRTWHYLGRNALIVAGVDFTLPGAFAANPFPGSVNASLWTLPLEVWMYIVLAIEWWSARKLQARLGPRGLSRMLLASAVGLLVLTFATSLTGHPSNSLRHAAMFFSAAWIYEVRAAIALRTDVAALACAILAGGAMLSHGAFEIAYRLVLPYVVLYAAYVPGGLIRRYNRVGDLSYGIYIYAFPLQQITAALFPGIGTGGLFLIASAMTLLAAALSWRLVESPALRLRSRIEARRS